MTGVLVLLPWYGVEAVTVWTGDVAKEWTGDCNVVLIGDGEYVSV